ncbi:mechanosensitive ion channel family protein [Thalassorhabdomicrobium marinisediminis]|uniref:Small-conductance mechanosensitive channel n=1 Tax=Thalassorhabdomicrobium marinisediminis TaxID=2170577 RepID=A0A2T7FT08_9RHOB|nr:mechanosensitive ion channel family protein [Thalassorhabdomicrobium marinisediminis]PVA05285.1 mechanosensitive ion channel protein MscS [Thalassorhabdomicrobium marinisediminis]
MEPITILMNQLRDIARGAIEVAPMIVVAILVLFLTWGVRAIATSILDRVLRRTKLRASLKELFHLLLSIFIWTMGIMVAAVIVFPGLTPASILAGLGLGSVAIGFAFKDVFENFLAGIIILFRPEMRIGDFIECEDVEGVVEHIAIRETHIKQTDGQLVIVPNSILFKNPVWVRTDQPKRRVTVMCGVAYDVDVDEARDVITRAVKSCDTVEQTDKPVQIFAQAFGASSIDFEVTWWTGSKPVDIRTSRDQVVAAVKRALDDAGLEIPFPYRTLTFKEPLPVRQMDADDAPRDGG